MYQENFIGKIIFFHESSISTCYIAFVDDSNQKVHIGYLEKNKDFSLYLEKCLNLKFPCELSSINEEINRFCVTMQKHKLTKIECLSSNMAFYL